MAPRRHLVNVQRETQGGGGILLAWIQVQVLKEIVGFFFLSGPGHGKVSYEIVNALECFGHPSAVITPNTHSRVDRMQGN